MSLPVATIRVSTRPGSGLSTEPKLNWATTNEAATVNPCMRSVGMYRSSPLFAAAVEARLLEPGT